MLSGSCPTSRKCSTTTLCSVASICIPISSQVILFMNVLSKKRSIMLCERWSHLKVACSRHRMQIARLMLRSFAEAARYLERPDYLQVATNNAEFLLGKLNRNGRLLRTYKDGRARLNGYLEDYAFLADGLLALYEASFQPRWFTEAKRLNDEAITLFADQQNGGFFDTGSDHEALISRPKDIMDNATPAGNSVAVDVLLRLAAFTGEEAYCSYADDYLRPIAAITLHPPHA